LFGFHRDSSHFAWDAIEESCWTKEKKKMVQIKEKAKMFKYKISNKPAFKFDG